MPTKDDFDRELSALQSAKRAMAHCGTRGWDEFQSDPTLQDAVIYRLAVVGEAARLVPDSLRREFPDIPWRKINAMRNILVHDYKGVELTHVWDVLQNHAPVLVQLIEAYLHEKGIQP